MRSKKDILFLCQYFYPEYVSSAILPFQTAKALVDAGFSVGALCGYPKEYNQLENVPKLEVYEGIKIKRVRYLQLNRSTTLGRLVNQLSFTLAVFCHLFELRHYKTVMVYSNPPILPLVASVASMLFGVRMIFVSFDVYPEIAENSGAVSSSSLLSRVMMIVNKSVFKRACKVIAMSTEMKEYLIDKRGISDPGMVEVIPNWYPDEGCLRFSVEELSNKTFSRIRTKSKLVVSYFGNLGVCQDLDTILGAIRELRHRSEFHFLFAGHGVKMELLRNIVDDERLENVTVLDFLHGSEFKEALAISDCFVVSLRGGLTGLAVPSKTYTYMMAGKPIIAIIGDESDIARDLLENDAGFVVDEHDHLSLVRALEDLLSDESKRLSMGSNCRRVYLQKYTLGKSTQKYVDMFRRIMAEKS